MIEFQDFVRQFIKLRKNVIKFWSIEDGGKHESKRKKTRVIATSPYAKEIKDFVRKLEELFKRGELAYTKDPFWSLEPVDLGKTDSSKLEHILY